jgi:hypothetical protein
MWALAVCIGGPLLLGAVLGVLLAGAWGLWFCADPYVPASVRVHRRGARRVGGSSQGGASVDQWRVLRD